MARQTLRPELSEAKEQGLHNIGEASAATGVSVGIVSAPPTLVVDRPFLFFVRHKSTGAILFQGRVVDPSR